MNEILIQAFMEAVKNERMTIEQVPIPYKEAVEEAIEITCEKAWTFDEDEARLLAEEMD